MVKMTTPDSTDGSRRLFACACRCVEYDLTDADAITTIRRYERVNPFPKKWSDRDILTRLQDAEKRTERGKKTNKQKPVEDEGNPPKTQGVDGRGRCKIRRSCDEHVMAREAIAALSTADNLYQRFGFLVGVTRQTEETVEHGVARKGRTPRIRDLKRGPLREALSEYCFSGKQTKMAIRIRSAFRDLSWIS